jgi:hypothetical protein
MFLPVKLNYPLGNLIIPSLDNKNQPKVDLAGINLIEKSLLI